MSAEPMAIDMMEDRETMFHAVTLRPTPYEPAIPMLRRERILKSIFRSPSSGVLSFLVGPIGSGKTTVAMQWVGEVGEDVQYVCARPYDDLPAEWVHPPSELGLAIAAFMNACSKTTRNPSRERIGAALERVVELSSTSGERFVMDDIELFGPDATEILLPLLAVELPRARTASAMIISRTMNSEILASLHALPHIRVILPMDLALDTTETPVAHALGVFGDIPLDRLREIRESVGGWWLGILSSMEGYGGRSIAPDTFVSRILNELLVSQPPSVVGLVVTSTYLPRLTVSLWNDLFSRADATGWGGVLMLSQLPTKAVDPDSEEFSIVEPMRRALRTRREITTPNAVFVRILELALQWYVRHGDLVSARQLATERNLVRQFLHALRPRAERLAEREDWAAIHALVDGMTPDQLVLDPEMAWWYYHGLAETDRWAEMKRLLDLAEREWQHTDDPVVQARLLAARCQDHQFHGRGAEAFEDGVASYNMYPVSYAKERMWAAGMASIAASFIGNTTGSRHWSALANFEATNLGSVSRWWHNDAGVARYGWLAVAGMLEEAYEAATRQVRSLHSLEDPSCAVRYLLLKAQIDIERLRFDSAASLLEEAESLSDGMNSQPHFLRVQRAELARAMGDPDIAWETLSFAGSAATQRYDHFLRETFARARLAIEMRERSTAMMLIDSVPLLEDTWPRQFGDAHPDLVQALVRAGEGGHDDAIATAHGVLREAERRKHLYWIVQAQATLAYFYDRVGEFALRDSAIDEVVSAAGQSGFQLAFVVHGMDVRQLRSSRDVAAPTIASDRTPNTLRREDRSNVLTTREVEVLAMLARNMSNKEIADTLFLSISTVKNHLRNAYNKLGTDNRRSAVRVARSLGLIEE